MVSTFVRRAARFGLAVLLLYGAASAGRAATSYKQPSFHETVVLSGLTNPAAVRFLPDGRVVVAEKSGLIKVFDSLSDPTATVVADLRTKVHNFWDRGLLGLTVDPNFATNNFIYVLYAHDAYIGGTAPRWGTAGATSDGCPTPPGATGDGCVISGHLSRLTATGTNWETSEQVLIEDWCQQYPSHSTGSLAFGADGYLYVTGGDGASFNTADWGQLGGSAGSPTPANPCGDPPFPVGTAQTKPTAEGGALRSQSPRRTSGEPRVLNGTLLRVDPATGLAAPDNPLASSSDLNERRIVGYGLRNPFRMIVKPGTSDVWIADVGWSTWEEINRLPDVSTVRNFGWPCYEGNATQYTGLTICPSTIGQTTTPFYTYNHSASVVAGDGCTTGSSSVAGMAFYQGGSNYPASYDGALFFSDYSRKCLWVMFPGGSGDPDPANRAAFAATAQGPVDLQIGPDGNLYYADFDGGRIIRVEYGPVAAASGAPLSGTAPLTVDFSSAGSAPAQAGDTISYAWDLDGDGQYDDSTLASPSFLYTDPGTYTVRLKVTDNHGATNVSSPLTVSAGNTAPTAFIDAPLASLTWQVNDTISFSGHATDPQQGALPASALSWTILIHHCPSNCHTHVYQTFDGVAGGSFPAPDHEYPAYLEIRLTATDAGDLTHETSVDIQPQTVDLSFSTVPAGRQLSVGTFTGAAPFTRTVIRNSSNGVDALAPQGTFPDVWDFASWSDGGAEQHAITGTASASYTATYVRHADLSIAIAASPEPVGAGANLTYTVDVANAGPSQASSLSVGVTLPAGSSYVSAGGTGWTCGGTGPVTCTMPSLGIAAAPPITVVATAPPEAGPIGNTASVTSAIADAATANNAASTSTNVFARADLAVSQSGAPASICTSQPIAYTLNVSNAGPSTATSVSVADTLPAGAVLVSASGSGWACSGTATVTCTRASLAVGAAPSINVTIDAPASAGIATNNAAISSAVNDPSAGNDSSSAATTVNAVPSAPSAGNGGAVCVGGTLQLNAATVAGATYAWTGPNGFTSSQQNPTIPGVTLAAAGTYNVTVTVASCTSAAGTTVATVHALPTAAVSGNGVVCAGGAVPIQAVLTGAGPWNLVWSDGFAQNGVATSPATRSVSPAATTTYTVASVSDAHCAGGAGSGSALVTVNPRPTAAAGGTAEICAGGSTPLSGSGGVSCSWAPATGLSNPSSCAPTAAPSATTTYTLTVTDANGCVSNNAPSVTVTVQPKPTATVSGSASVCAGGSTMIQAVVTGAGPWNLVWSDGFAQNGVAASPATRSVAPASTTAFSIASVSDAHCAGTASGSALVTVKPLPTATVSGSAEICAGASTTIQAALAGTGPWTVVWSDGATQSNVASSPASRTVSPAATTSYAVTSVSDANCAGGAGSGGALVTVDPRPTAAASGSAAICPGGSAPLSGSGGVSCLWAPSTGLSNASSCSPTATPSATTVYTLTVTSAAGCVSTNAPSVTVTVNATPPAPTASNDGPVCAGQALQLSASGPPGAAYGWTGPNGFTSNAQNPAIPSPTEAASGVYSVTVTLDGCESAATTTTALVRPLPAAAVSGSATICAGASTELTAVLAGTGPWTLLWSDGALQNAPASPAVREVNPDSTTVYTVTSVTDAHCASIGTGSAEIVVRDPVAAPAITAPPWAAIGATGLAASAPAHAGSSYDWTLAGGSIASGQGTASITLDAGPPGTTMKLSVVETDTGCSSPIATRRIQVDFLDVPPAHAFHDFVDTLASNGVTAGCGIGTYCPDASNTRAQMAVFVLKSKFGEDHVPPDAVGIFADVPSTDPFAPWVEEAASLQITVGCGGGNFCPAAPVTRGQMAVVLLKALLGFDYAPPEATGTLFGDVPEGSFAAAWIEDLYNRGITGGCQPSPLMYCPATPVTRGQMAVFLVKAFGLD